MMMKLLVIILIDFIASSKLVLEDVVHLVN